MKKGYCKRCFMFSRAKSFEKHGICWDCYKEPARRMAYAHKKGLTDLDFEHFFATRSLRIRRHKDEVIKSPRVRRVSHLGFLNRALATPKWVSAKELCEIYKNCPRGMQIDHIVPICGGNVCGLHVPWNLEYVTPYENLKRFRARQIQLLELESRFRERLRA